jgi:transcriptional regulator with XRE-family HTH domain
MRRKEIRKHFARAITAILDELGMSLEEFGELVGLGENKASTVSSWKHGVIPRWERIQRIAEVTHKPIEFFIPTGRPPEPDDLSAEERKLLMYFRGTREARLRRHTLRLARDNYKESLPRDDKSG